MKFLIVLKKELLELMRDRRALLKAILLPALLMPLMSLIFGAVGGIIAAKQQMRTLNYTLYGEPIPYAIAGAFRPGDGFHSVPKIPGKTPQEAVTGGDIDFALVLAPQPNGDTFSDGWQIIYKDDSTSKTVFNRVERALRPAAETWQKQQLETLQVRADAIPHLLKPLQMTETNLANERARMGELSGGILFYLLALAVMIGAQYPSIDLVVGEKERHTLESLLVTPLTALQLASAKIAAAATAGTASLVCAVISLCVCLSGVKAVFASHVPILANLPDVGDIIGGALLLLPIALIMGAVLLTAACFANSFKEAQTHVAPAAMLLVAPLVLTFLPNMSAEGFMSVVPIANAVLAAKDLVKGELMASTVVLVWVVNLAVAALLVRLAARRLGHERMFSGSR